MPAPLTMQNVDAEANVEGLDAGDTGLLACEELKIMSSVEI